uniref:Uncharacterized protein n=1 Tax=Oryza meridionalis TaxID=40149 RepID=A0A0E0EYN3_9ORYZ
MSRRSLVTLSTMASTATSNASFIVSSLDDGCAYTTAGMSETTVSLIRSTAAGEIRRSRSSMLALRRTSSSEMCQVYWTYAVPGWKNTGMQPASMASNADLRVYESPCGWRQKVELWKSLM